MLQEQKGIVNMPQELFAETVAVNTSLHSVSLVLLNKFHMPPDNVGIVHLPLTIAKQLCMILRKQLLEYEVKNGILVIPAENFNAMGVSPEDWGNWLK